MFTSFHEPYSMVFFSVLMLAQFSCVAIHAAFLEDSMQLNKMMKYARSLERLAIAKQDRSDLNIDECRQEARVGKQELEQLSQTQLSAFPWLETRHSATDPGRMTSRS